MNVRVQMAPPSRGLLTRVVLGTEAALTSPRPMSWPAASRSACTRAARAASAGQVRVRFVAGDAEVGGPGHDDRHAVVDAGDLDAIDDVQHAAGRQQCAGGRARGISEQQADRRGGAGDAGDRGTEPPYSGTPPGVAKVGGNDAAGVHHPDAGCGGLRAGLDQPALGRERADSGQDVPAVLLVGDRRLLDAELQEQVVDVGVVTLLTARRRRPWTSADARRRARRSAAGGRCP